MRSHPKIIAHRGGAGLRPENTMAAINHALALGVDGIEVDVHLSADGQVIVHHDDALNPHTTRLNGEWLPETGPLVKDLSFAALQRYDVGRLQPGSSLARKHPNQVAVDGERIPLLSDVLARLDEEDAFKAEILIELKTHPIDPTLSSDPDHLVQGILDALRHAGMIERAVLISFNWDALDYALRCQPDMRTGYLTYPREELIARKVPEDLFITLAAGPDVFHAMAKRGAVFWGPLHREASKDFVALAHACGLEVSVWTANDRAAYDALVHAEVDYITTDYPDRMLDYRRG